MPKHLYRVMNGIVACNGVITRAGDTIELTEEEAAGARKGWLERIPDYKAYPAPKPEPEPEPTPEPEEEHKPVAKPPVKKPEAMKPVQKKPFRK